MGVCSLRKQAHAFASYGQSESGKMNAAEKAFNAKANNQEDTNVPSPFEEKIRPLGRKNENNERIPTELRLRKQRFPLTFHATYENFIEFENFAKIQRFRRE